MACIYCELSISAETCWHSPRTRTSLSPTEWVDLPPWWLGTAFASEGNKLVLPKNCVKARKMHRIGKQYEFRSQHWKVWVVLQDILMYRIDIECEPKTDYEQCSNQHRITSKIDMEWQNRQRSVWFLRYWITFWKNSCKNCSFCQFWGIFWWYSWNVRT